MRLYETLDKLNWDTLTEAVSDEKLAYHHDLADVLLGMGYKNGSEDADGFFYCYKEESGITVSLTNEVEGEIKDEIVPSVDFGEGYAYTDEDVDKFAAKLKEELKKAKEDLEKAKKALK